MFGMSWREPVSLCKFDVDEQRKSDADYPSETCKLQIEKDLLAK